jgi:hypothetical protein
MVNSHCQALDGQLPDILELRREVKDFSNCTRNCLVAPIRLEHGTLRTIAKALKDSECSAREMGRCMCFRELRC